MEGRGWVEWEITDVVDGHYGRFNAGIGCYITDKERKLGYKMMLDMSEWKGCLLVAMSEGTGHREGSDPTTWRIPRTCQARQNKEA